MANFLNRYHLAKLNQGQINSVNISITPSKIEAVNKSLQTKRKSPGLDGLSAEFYQTFKEELTPIDLKLFHKTQIEGTLPNSFL